jgi:hypothetical protein
MANAAEIWKTLSKIDCSSKTMEKGGLTYLPWNQAVTYMMDHYPDYTVKWHGTTDQNNVTRDITYYEGGTAMVCCAVTIGEVKRECWLPVMDYRNKAIAHPSSRDISDAKQRCLVKCFALFGLGIYIYRGDAVPEGAEPETPVKTKKVTVDSDKKQLAVALQQLSDIVVACEENGTVVEARHLDLARSVIQARGTGAVGKKPLERVQGAIAYLETEVSGSAEILRGETHASFAGGDDPRGEGEG